MTLEDLWRYWGDELPLHEASAELDPPLAERLENACWQIARAARTKATIYRGEFDGREQEQRPQHSTADMRAESEKIAKSWPHKAKEKPQRQVQLAAGSLSPSNRRGTGRA